MYIVIELQTSNGQTGNLVYAYENKNEAESKFYQIMSAAAVSPIEAHSALLVDQHGAVYNVGSYDRSTVEQS